MRGRALRSAALVALVSAGCASPPASRLRIRVATFNTSLHRNADGELAAELARGSDQARAIAKILRHTSPDIVLLNEFDFDLRALDLFCERYLGDGQNGSCVFEHRFTAPVNTGVPTGIDLDRDGRTDGPGDAFGFGRHEGQYGMVLLSRFPIRVGEVRTFRRFLWKDMPGALLPDDPSTQDPGDWYPPEALALLRLSSKSHWDVPVELPDGSILHVLASHPTPPVFDGPEDRNGRRNHDEIRLWADYVEPQRAGYLVDDQGRRGGLESGSKFVILGDLNADPHDGDTTNAAVGQLLEHPRVRGDVVPTSAGAAEQARLQGAANAAHRGDPAADTGDFSDEPGPGNLRADYVLPSRGLEIEDAGVFWPASTEPEFALVGTAPFPSSDHRLVWIDIRL